MVAIDGDPASDEVRFRLIMVKHKATFRTTAPVAAFGFGGVSYVEIDGAFGAVFFSHVTSPVKKERRPCQPIYLSCGVYRMSLIFLSKMPTTSR